MQSPSSDPMPDPDPTPDQSPTGPPTAPGPDPLARQLIGGLLCSLLLLIPLRVALEVRTDVAVMLWIVVGVAMVLAFGLVLLWSRVPHGISVAAATAGCFLLAAVAAMPVLAQIGDPGHDTAITLMVALAATAVATPVSVAVVARTGDAAIGAALGLLIAGMALTAAVGRTAGETVFDARDDAEALAELEDAGIEGYLPEIGDLEVVYRGEHSSAETGRATGYTLRYGPSDVDDDGASVHVRVSREPMPPCEEIADVQSCEEGAGYVVTWNHGRVDEITAARGTMTLTAEFYDGSGTLPDTDEVGAALAEAELVELEDVVELEQ